MPEYMLLIYGAADDQRSPEEMAAELPAWFEYTEELQASGAMVAGAALQPIETATSVRVRDGKTLSTDGPFAETREQFGGYYLIEAKDLDEAIGIAARIPSAKIGTVEIRPVVIFDNM